MIGSGGIKIWHPLTLRLSSKTYYMASNLDLSKKTFALPLSKICSDLNQQILKWQDASRQEPGACAQCIQKEQEHLRDPTLFHLPLKGWDHWQAADHPDRVSRLGLSMEFCQEGPSACFCPQRTCCHALWLKTLPKLYQILIFGSHDQIVRQPCWDAAGLCKCWRTMSYVNSIIIVDSQNWQWRDDGVGSQMFVIDAKYAT